MAAEHRRGEPGARYVRMDPDTQRLIRLVADEDGVIPIRDEVERRVADAIGLAVTRLPKLGPKEVRALQAKATKEAD